MNKRETQRVETFVRLLEAHDRDRWAIIDLLLRDDDLDALIEAARERTSRVPARQTVYNWRHLGNRWPHDRRRYDLSFSVHEILAALPDRFDLIHERDWDCETARDRAGRGQKVHDAITGSVERDTTDDSAVDWLNAAVVGDACDVLPGVLALHVPTGAVIADTTYGTGNMWARVTPDSYVLKATDLVTGTDCRDLPYDDDTLDAGVLDPPYKYSPKGSDSTRMNSEYGTRVAGLRSTADVLALYRDAMDELWRCIRPGGVLIVKTQNGVEGSRMVWLDMAVRDIASEQGWDLIDVRYQVNVHPTRDPKWKKQHHFRQNLSLWYAFRKPTRHR